jgi:hypothetical protein
MGAIKRIGGWIKRDKDMILALLCGILATQLNNIISPDFMMVLILSILSFSPSFIIQRGLTSLTGLKTATTSTYIVSPRKYYNIARKERKGKA